MNPARWRLYSFFLRTAEYHCEGYAEEEVGVLFYEKWLRNEGNNLQFYKISQV